MEASVQKQVDRFCRQYLQLEQTLNYPEPQHIRRSDVQDAIYHRLFAEDSLPAGAPPLRYQLRVLKELISRIEASIEDWDEHGVSDGLMSSLSVLFSTPAPNEDDAVQQKYAVVYHLASLPGHEAHIDLFENRALIAAGGTTGLRTWEAALHLGQLLCHDPSLVSGKRVLELGAGTGYLSILCVKYLGATHVIASDGSDDVINNLPENLCLNQIQDSSAIRPMDLKWGHALGGTEEKRWNGGSPLDVVLGADITYDPSIIPDLVGTLLDLFGLYPHVEVIIAATQRNLQTFRVFLERCQREGLKVEDVSFEIPPRDQQEGPFYNDQVAIRICKVSKS
ncbi:Protein-lysine N-methyltransferase EFM3 [Trichoderma ghanense]|uniref:Protein-lysine N-methyltransferase EFM3 n=1 Tax=Trichoderma ghanense TaxID=65468 RepID=A0ABY2HGX1_9HYPO